MLSFLSLTCHLRSPLCLPVFFPWCCEWSYWSLLTLRRLLSFWKSAFSLAGLTEWEDFLSSCEIDADPDTALSVDPISNLMVVIFAALKWLLFKVCRLLRGLFSWTICFVWKCVWFLVLWVSAEPEHKCPHAIAMRHWWLLICSHGFAVLQIWISQ